MLSARKTNEFGAMLGGYPVAVIDPVADEGKSLSLQDGVWETSDIIADVLATADAITAEAAAREAADTTETVARVNADGTLQAQIDTKAPLVEPTFTAPLTVNHAVTQGISTQLDGTSLIFTRSTGSSYISNTGVSAGTATTIRSLAADGVTQVNRIVVNAGDNTTVDVYNTRARAVAAVDTPLTARAYVTGTADIAKFQNGAGTDVAKIDSTGTIISNSSSGSATYGGSGIVINRSQGYLNNTSIGGALNFTVSNVSTQDLIAARIFSNGQMQVGGNTGALASIVPLVARGAPSHSVNIFEVQDTAGSAKAKFDAAGRLGLNFGAGGFSGQLGVQPNATNVPGVVVKALSGQTGALFEGQDNSGVAMFSVASNGKATIAPSTTAGVAYLIVKQAAATGANFQEWQDNTGAAKAWVDAAGNVLAPIIQTRVAGDVTGKISMAGATGDLEFGDGTLSRDVRVGRPAVGQLRVAPTGGASSMTFIVKATSTQSTTNLQEWQQSTGSVMASIGGGGIMTAPRYISLATGDSDNGLTIQRASATGRAQQRLLSETGVEKWRFGMTGAGGDSFNFFDQVTGTVTLGWQSSPKVLITTTDAGHTPLALKLAAGQTAGAFDIQSSTGVSLASVRNDGYWRGAGLLSAADSGPYLSISGTTVAAKNRTSAANVVFVTTGLAGQTGDHYQAQNEVGAVLARISNMGLFRGIGLADNASGKAFIGTASQNATDTRIDSTGVTVATNLAGNKGLVVRGEALQTANLIETQDNTGAILAAITGAGDMLLSKGGGGTAGPGIYVESASSGAVDSELLMTVAGVGSTNTLQGPQLIMRGNNFSRLANQRGMLYFGAGAPTTPVGNDGKVRFVSTVANQLESGATTAVAATMVGFAGQTANLTEWQNDTGTVLSSVEANGWHRVPGLKTLTDQGPTLQPTTGGMLVQNRTSAGNAVLIARGMAGQSGDLLRGQDNGGTDVLRLSAAGSVVAGGRMLMGTMNVPTGVAHQVTGTNTTDAVLAAKANAAGATGDLLQLLTNTAAVLFSFTAAGRPKWASNTLVQNTVGAAGLASALPANPTKYLQVVDDLGNTLVVPAYAAI